MANWYQDQLTNKNFLSPIGFLFILDRAKKVSFLCQKASIPAFTTGNIEIPTRGFVTIPVESTATYEDLSIDFIVDEDLRNYMELHNWMRALSTPGEYKDRYDWNTENSIRGTKNDPRYSDATLQVLNNNNLANFDVVFKNCFPINLSSLPFDVTSSDNNYFTATATFRYTLYEVRDINSSTRR